MLLQLAPNSPLTALPQYVWVRISTDTAHHKIPCSSLFWDRSVLKTKMLGQITEVHDSDPRVGLPPANLGPQPLPPPAPGPAPAVTDFQRLALKYHATSTKGYNQGADEHLARHQQTSEGACIYLSLRWLADQKSGEDFFSIRFDKGSPNLNEATTKAAVQHMAEEMECGPGPGLTALRKNKADAMGLKAVGAPHMSLASSYAPDSNQIQLQRDQSLDDLPSCVWARTADGGYHKVFKTALFWNNKILKTKRLGRIIELFKQNPSTLDAPIFGRGVLDRARASSHNFLMLALHPASDDQQNGGHAMAIRRDGESYTIFDPNGGSATFGSYLDAENFFQEYWAVGRNPYATTYDQFLLNGFS